MIDTAGNHFPERIPCDCKLTAGCLKCNPMTQKSQQQKTPYDNIIESCVTELAEMIIIDYANFSGREEANRAVFRDHTINNLRSKITELVSSILDNEECGGSL